MPPGQASALFKCFFVFSTLVNADLFSDLRKLNMHRVHRYIAIIERCNRTRIYSRILLVSHAAALLPCWQNR